MDARRWREKNEFDLVADGQRFGGITLRVRIEDPKIPRRVWTLIAATLVTGNFLCLCDTKEEIGTADPATNVANDNCVCSASSCPLTR
jgi:hypothetical protein